MFMKCMYIGYNNMFNKKKNQQNKTVSDKKWYSIVVRPVCDSPFIVCQYQNFQQSQTNYKLVKMRPIKKDLPPPPSMFQRFFVSGKRT